MSTDGLHLKTVAMLQGSSHLRVQSSAEFQVAAGAKYVLVPNLTTFSGAGNKGTLPRDGITIWTCTGTGDNSTCIATLPAPAIGSYKMIVFRAVNATSNRQRVVTSSKGVKIGTSHTSIIATSNANKLTNSGPAVQLIGLSTSRWMLMNFASTNSTSVGGLGVTLTSATG
jgi:hypothetical protein